MFVRFSYQRLLSVIGVFVFSLSVLAADLRCDVCGMPLNKHDKNHILLKSRDSEKSPLHVCSLSCAKKAIKHDKSLNEVKVNDFNHPEQELSGESAFFLIKSEKIRSDLGENVMGPYFGAFSSKKDADEAKAKYGDGVIVKGLEEALK